MEKESISSGCVEEEMGEFDNLGEVEDLLKYKFHNISFLEEALTHSSYGNQHQQQQCKSYERLEYIGDSVLNLLVTREQFLNYPDLHPGALTRLRALNVDTEKLARVSLKLNLHHYVRHNQPTFLDIVKEFIENIEDFPLHSNGLVRVPKMLADIVESTIGAVYMDSSSSLEVVWMVFEDLLQPIIRPEMLRLHPKVELIQMCQKKGLRVKFVDISEKHTIEVFVDDTFVGKSCFCKKDIAKNRAAKVALENVTKLLMDKLNVAKESEEKIMLHGQNEVHVEAIVTQI